MAKKENKEYKAAYLKEYKEPIFEPKLIPWLNEDTINSDISIE